METTTILEEEDPPHHVGQEKEYLLVCDLPQRVRTLRLAGLTTPASDDDIFLSIQEQMVENFQKLLPTGTSLRVIDMQELADSILTRAQNIVADLDHGYIISTCSEIAQMAHGMTIEVNRLADETGKVIGVGSRPGYPDLPTQFSAALKAAAGRPIVLIEDGTFTGTTMSNIVKQLKDRGATIASIVLGFAFPESRSRLQEVIDFDRVHLIHELNQPVDWVPDHDFFPFIPNCGRVIGVPINGTFCPYYDFNGDTFSIPYLTAFCPMSDWIGIKTEANRLLGLTHFFLDSTSRIFEKLEQLNNKTIRFSDLRHIRPRVCIPWSIGQHGVSELIHNQSVRQYLRHLKSEID